MTEFGDGTPDADAITAFLLAHPGWLADRPELYRRLHPPVRLHGERLADHMAAMLRVARERADTATARAETVLAAGRLAASLTTRVQEAVLALMGAADAVDCVVNELPGLLAVDAVSLCAEGRRRGAQLLPRGAVAALLGARDVVYRDAPDDRALLHAEAAALARHDALIRVEGLGVDTLLALASRDRMVLDPAQGAATLAFLGRAVGLALA
jgi:uncharacterized protein YigA (DUF484 family)